MPVRNLTFERRILGRESHLPKGYIDFIQQSPSFCKILRTKSQIQAYIYSTLFYFCTVPNLNTVLWLQTRIVFQSIAPVSHQTRSQLCRWLSKEKSGLGVTSVNNGVASAWAGAWNPAPGKAAPSRPAALVGTQHGPCGGKWKGAKADPICLHAGGRGCAFRTLPLPMLHCNTERKFNIRLLSWYTGIWTVASWSAGLVESKLKEPILCNACVK